MTLTSGTVNSWTSRYWLIHPWLMELGKWASFAPFFSLYDIPFPELASRVNEDAALQERSESKQERSRPRGIQASPKRSDWRGPCIPFPSLISGGKSSYLKNLSFQFKNQAESKTRWRILVQFNERRNRCEGRRKIVYEFNLSDE